MRKFSPNTSRTGRFVSAADIMRQSLAATQMAGRIRRTAIAEGIRAGYKVTEFQDCINYEPGPDPEVGPFADLSELEKRVLSDPNSGAWFEESAQFSRADWDNLKKSVIYKKLYGGEE